MASPKSPSRAGSLPQVHPLSANSVFNTAPLWERACSRWRWVSWRDAGWADAFAGKPAPTRGCRLSANLVFNAVPLWERACSRWRWVSQRDVGWADAIASKLAPTKGDRLSANHVFNAVPLWERACSRKGRLLRHLFQHLFQTARPSPYALKPSRSAPGCPGPGAPICA